MYRRLLVPGQDVLDLILLEKLVVNEQYRTARIAEYVLDLFFLEAPDYNLRARQLHYFRSIG
jgi:hypothetical protein